MKLSMELQLLCPECGLPLDSMSDDLKTCIALFGVAEGVLCPKCGQCPEDVPGRHPEA